MDQIGRLSAWCFKTTNPKICTGGFSPLLDHDVFNATEIDAGTATAALMACGNDMIRADGHATGIGSPAAYNIVMRFSRPVRRGFAGWVQDESLTLPDKNCQKGADTAQKSA
jgi:hypothetical protein